MLAILSPAKNMRVPKPWGFPLSRPRFLPQARELAGVLRQYPPWQLESILRVNPQIALRAFGYYQNFDAAPDMPALLSYHGLAYQYLDAATLSAGDLEYAQNHLRLLSALYGVLRPADGIRPHRLEMTSRLSIRGENLYRFWGGAWRDALFGEARTVVNLASAEYGGAVSRRLSERDRMVDCVFLNPSRGTLRQLAAPAKMARGAMARFMLQNRIDRPEGLKDFHWDGYRYVAALSGTDRYVFARGTGFEEDGGKDG